MTEDGAVHDAIRRTLSVQSAAIESLADEATIAAIERTATVIEAADGGVILAGIGKSGDVARKIASTFNSVGVESRFIHPVEALHGDLGALSPADVVILVSNSGNTDEMVELLRFLEALDPTTVAITSDASSKLGQRADHHIETKVEEEGAVVDLVPMASATVTMVIGDCIANALMSDRDFGREEYGHFHPGGTIGKRLLLEIRDLMHEDVPRTAPSETLAQVVLDMSKGGKGIAVIRDTADSVEGILTDGDIRRLIETESDFHDVTAREVMIRDPITVSPETAAIRGLEILEDHNITQLVVTGSTGEFLGVVHLHDILQEGLTT